MNTEITTPTTHTSAPTDGMRILIELFNGEQEVRKVVDELGNAWFCANDLCDILGYERVSETIAAHCDESGTAKRRIRSGGQARELLFINEPNLYSLVCSSKKAKAKEFKKWVFEVLAPAGVRGVPVAPAAPAITEERLVQLMTSVAADVVARSLAALPQPADRRGEERAEARSGLFPELWSVSPWGVLETITTDTLCHRLGCQRYVFERAMLAHGVLVRGAHGTPVFPSEHGEHGFNDYAITATGFRRHEPVWYPSILAFIRRRF